MKKLLTFLTLLTLFFSIAGATEVIDIITLTTTGVTATAGGPGSSYVTWSGKTANSNAVYAGNSSGGYSVIQLRSNSNGYSGIVSTSSGGRIKSVSVLFNTNTSNSNRTLSIYGSNTAYTSSSDLYDTSKQGTLIGSCTKSNTALLHDITVSGDYAFIGFKANNAMYIDKIEITWEEGGTQSGLSDPTISFSGFTEGGTTVTATIDPDDNATTTYYRIGDDETVNYTEYTTPVAIDLTENASPIKVYAYSTNDNETTDQVYQEYNVPALGVSVSPSSYSGYDPVTVNIAASNNVGTATLTYKINDNAVQPYSSFTLSEPGEYTITAYATDQRAGGEPVSTTASINIEEQPSGETKEATYIFNTDAGLAALGINKPDDGQGTPLGSSTYTVGQVTLSSTSPSNANSATRIYNSGGKTSLRVYKNGGSITLSVPEDGYTITNIEITGQGLDNFNASIGNYDNGAWSGLAQSVTFTATNTVTIYTINVTYLAPEAPAAPDYYLAGSMNGWDPLAEDYIDDYKFTAKNDGSYVLNNVNLPAGSTFKIIKVVGEEKTWYGGPTNDNEYEIKGNWHANMPLATDNEGGKNYKMSVGGESNVTITPEFKLSVNPVQLFIKTALDDYATATEMTALADGTGWTHTMTEPFAVDNHFGFIDNWGVWHGGEWDWITEDYLGKPLNLYYSDNYLVKFPGTYIIKVNNDLSKMTPDVVRNPHDITCIATSDVPKDEGEGFKEGGTVVAKVDGSNATQAPYLKDVTLDIRPWNGYTLASVKVQGDVSGNIIEVTDNTFKMPDEAVTVTASFTTAGENTITYISAHGTCNGPTSATVGQAIEFTISDIEDGYSIAGVSATFINNNGGTTAVKVNHNQETGVYSFGMPPFDVKVRVNYTKHTTIGDGVTFKRISSENELVAGSKYIMVCEELDNPQAAGGLNGNKYLASVDVTIEGDIATIDDNVAVFTLGGESGAWTFTYNEQLLGAHKNKELTLGDEQNSTTTTTITVGTIDIEQNDHSMKTYNYADIDFGLWLDGTSENGSIKYNSSAPRFLNYNTEYSTTVAMPIQLYKEVPAEAPEPPMFWPEDPEELQPEGFYVEIYCDYDNGQIYYMLDPENEPDATTVRNSGALCNYGSWGEVYVDGPGTHTFYAVVEVGGVLSEKATITYNTYALGDWKLVENESDIMVDHYEYIIVNNDFTKVAGAYNNGTFAALNCENNVTFDPSFETATVAENSNVKIFTFEYVEGSGSWRYGYLKDKDNHYYYPSESNNDIEESKSLIWPYNGGHYGYVYIDNENNSVIAYDSDNGGGFNTYHYPDGKIDESRRIRMYYRARPVTLAEMEAGEMFQTYTISDALLAVECVTDDWGGVYLFCKDEGPSISESKNPEGYEDYMIEHSDFKGPWDQSNWIGLAFYNVSEDDLTKIQGCVNHHLKANSITIYKNNRDNFVYEMRVADLEVEDPSNTTTYTPNLYCPANFLRSNHNGNATGHTENTSDKHYFFVNPKLQEVCEITFAVWDGNYFVLPAPDGTTNNASEIHGAFNPDFMFNAVVDQTTNESINIYDALEVGQAYRFHAIVQGRQPKSRVPAYKADEDPVTPGEFNPDWYYTVYPFDFDPEESTVTAIETVNIANGNGEVKSVKYVNVAGIVSDTPFQGINIVVTEYTDGSRTTTKMLKK